MFARRARAAVLLVIALGHRAGRDSLAHSRRWTFEIEGSITRSSCAGQFIITASRS